MQPADPSSPSLSDIPVDRRLLEALHARGAISAAMKQQGIRLLHPPLHWGAWAGRLLSVFGVALILAGILYFFAFNWMKITPMAKLFGLQLMMLACIGGCYQQGLQRLSGKFLLLAASVLTGVCLAVFGQIYQTGADANQLFMVWSLLIFPWVLLSRFAGLWAVWVVVVNLFIHLYWEQEVSSGDYTTQRYITGILILFNGLLLSLREYAVLKGHDWLAPRWTRHLLLLPVIAAVCYCGVVDGFEFKYRSSNAATLFYSILAVVVPLLSYYIYRFRLPDMQALAATLLAICILLEVLVVRLLEPVTSSTFLIFLMGVISLGLFSGAIIHLQALARSFHVTRSSHE